MYQVRPSTGQALDQDVRDIKVGRSRKVHCQEILGVQWIKEDSEEGARSCRAESGDEKYLNNLKGKVARLCKQFNHVVCWNTSRNGAN
jgi:hypothetical protein